MKRNNLAPLAAGLLMSTMAGCSDTHLVSISGRGDDEQNGGPADAPADTPPNFPGSSLFANTCFGLLSEDSLAPLDTEAGDYYQPVLDWMDRTRTKLGVGLLERLRHYDPDRIGAVMEEYEEAGIDPTIDEVTEHMRELLVERGGTILWSRYNNVSNLNIVLGDRRSDYDFAVESRNETLESNRKNQWLIPDMRCWFSVISNTNTNIGGMSMNKMAPEEWDHIPLESNGEMFYDRVMAKQYLLESSISYFKFFAAGHCQPQLVDPSDYDADPYSFPAETTCFNDDMNPVEGDDLNHLLHQTTNNRLEELKAGTELLINAFAAGHQEEGRAYFEGDWFE